MFFFEAGVQCCLLRSFGFSRKQKKLVKTDFAVVHFAVKDSDVTVKVTVTSVQTKLFYLVFKKTVFCLCLLRHYENN